MLRHRSPSTAADAITTPDPAASNPVGVPKLLPLGALAAGFGLFNVGALAQVAPPAAAASAPRAPAGGEAALPTLSMKVRPESDDTSVRATTSTIGKGNQALRDIPQSVTVVTEKLIEDRRVDTVKQALHQTGGVTFQAAEGGEEDIRLRGFSLATSGDIYVDSLRDPAFYDRDTFSFDRVELLRGSASMLFGRGSTGGVVNQVNKLPFLNDATEINAIAGSGNYLRFTGDFNVKLGETAAARLNVMNTSANGHGGNDKLDKQGIAPTIRWGIGTNDEVYVSGYYLKNNNGINYGLPWLRQKGATSAAVPQDTTVNNPAGLIPGLDPFNYYGAASDYNAGSASLGTVGWTHRFADGSELKSAIRTGKYTRDLRSGTIRFYTNTTAANGPIVLAPGSEGPTFVTNGTLLTRGVNNKVQNMTTVYAQSDYSRKFNWLGISNDILTGVDLAHEIFNGYATVVPAGVTLDKNTPRTTIGTPNDGTGGVDESRREKRRQSTFDAKALGIYLQDMVQVTTDWKVLAGLRWDRFKGDYRNFQTATTATNTPPVGSELVQRGRSDSLWSKRAGVLYQPSETQSYHFSYGTSFNTSGDAYAYDAGGTNTPPEGSRNIELGAKLDLLDGRVSVSTSVFHTTKYNERNRDSPTGAPLPNDEYLLSGQRHAAGLDLDIAGRITPKWEVFGSYAWIPRARIDKGNPQTGAAESGERVGDRPSLTPLHSGSLWTTYQIIPALRVGGGINARSPQTPNRNPAGIRAPGYVSGDLLAEYTVSDALSFKLNVLNVTNKLYADTLYTGHYVPGNGRQVFLTMTGRF